MSSYKEGTASVARGFYSKSCTWYHLPNHLILILQIIISCSSYLAEMKTCSHNCPLQIRLTTSAAGYPSSHFGIQRHAHEHHYGFLMLPLEKPALIQTTVVVSLSDLFIKGMECSRRLIVQWDVLTHRTILIQKAALCTRVNMCSVNVHVCNISIVLLVWHQNQ